MSEELVQGRKKANLSQEELARRSGVSVDVIRHIERKAVHEPGFFTVADLATAARLDLGNVAERTRVPHRRRESQVGQQ